MIHNISNTPKEETGTKAARSIDRSATQHVRNPLQAMSYRQAKVLAVGSSRFFLLSLAAMLFESGLSKFHVCITDSSRTERQGLKELTDQVRKFDSEASIEEITVSNNEKDTWRQAVQPFQWILYVSEEGNIEELRALQSACKMEKKPLIPALCLMQAGVAGPLIHPDTEGCCESLWRRIHRSSLVKKNADQITFSPTAGDMLANVIVFELLKAVTEAGQSQLKKIRFICLICRRWKEVFIHSCLIRW